MAKFMQSRLPRRAVGLAGTAHAVVSSAAYRNRGLRLLVCLPLFLSLCLAAQSPAPVITVDHGPNAAAQQAKPYVVMVSLDGFRYDYAKKYRAKHLLELGAQGAIASQGMNPRIIPR